MQVLTFENLIFKQPFDNCDTDHQALELISKQFQQLLSRQIFLMELVFHIRLLDECEPDYNICGCIRGASSSDVFR